MLITFEGIDGCGKSTQIGLLANRLEKENIPFSQFREPGGTELSERIRSLLLDSGQRMNPVTELLLFSAARSQLISDEVLPRLERGEIVLLDRFYDSTTAYQGYGRKSADLQQIDALNRLAAHKLVPDLTVYLRIATGDAERRTASLAKDRMESSGNDFFTRVVRGFDEISEKNGRFVVVDALLSPEEIHSRVVREINRISPVPIFRTQ